MAMSLPSSMPFSSSIPRWSHDVFLSFRGIDARNTFVAYLYDALCRRGINTYRDDKDLERGESISPALFKAIEESMISIIILSPNYASSTWCLEELTKILDCRKTRKQIVLPIFYHVHPAKIRKCRGRFGKALANHQKKFKEDMKVKRWKASLKEVANLAGEHLKDGNESEFIKKIILWVDSKIVRYSDPLDVAEYPIGVEPRVEHLNALLGIGRNDITLMIGIYGLGGIGKTTIAKAVYNSIAHQFEARCFLPNVKDSSSEDGLVKMQKRLLEELLGNSISFSGGSAGGISAIKERLHSKRILLILDDITELSQLQKLARDRNWFGPGSRIIITTRDQHLLRSHDVDSTYEVLGLDNNEAIQLFSSHAFKRDMPIESYAELTECIIGYAKGLPLALMVLGSYLRGRSIQEWESTLEKYERNLPEDIYKILRISYDGLEDIEKDIFLDIACFFKGKELNYVKKILDHCGFSSTIGIKRLREMCLIDIVRYFKEDILEMHDLLQEMGKEIVRQESPNEAGKRRRLWFYEDVLHVLEENTGSSKVERILLDFPRGHKKINLHPEAFNAMKNLQLIINHNAEFSTGPNYLSNELRVFDWHNYPSPFLPSNFYGKKLTMFKITGGLIKELDGLKAKNMTRIELVDCKFITRIPDLSSSPNLKIFCLKDCENLVEIHHSVGFLDNLLEFSVMRCCQLRIFPERLKLRSLRELQLDGCKLLTRIPDLSSSPNLKIFCLKDCENLVVIHHSVGFLDNLLEFSVMRCCQLRIFPERLKLRSLWKLQLNGCKLLTRIPDLSSSPNLEHLVLHCCENLVEIHHSVGFLDKLSTFYATGCRKLRIFPKRLKLRSLRWLQLTGCPSLEDFPEIDPGMALPLPSSIGNLTSDLGINLGNTSIKELPSSIENLTNLRFFNLSNTSIKELPSSIGNLTGLTELVLNDIDIKELPSSIGNLTNLLIFDLSGTDIKELPSSIGNLARLLRLYLNGTDIKELPSSIGNLAQLLELRLSGTDIKELPLSVGNLTRLELLYLDRSSIIELPSTIGNITLLRVICARDCKNLVHLPSSINQLASLNSFMLDGCSQPINIGKVEDGTLSTTSVVPTGEREIASTSELTPINDTVWDVKTLSLEFCCLLESNFFVNNYFRNFKCLNLSGSDIVVFPQSGVRFDMLRILHLNNCKQLKEIRPLPSSIKEVEARGCTSLESFAEISEIVFKNNATRSIEGLVSIDLYGCYKLGVDMGLPSREQRGYEGQDRDCDKYIIYPGERIPRWFSYSKEVRDDNILCEIDINGAQHWDDIDKILLCFVFGLRVGSNPEMKETTIRVDIKTFDDQCLFTSEMKVNGMDLDHVWMGYCRPASGFEVLWWRTDDVVIKSVGVHFLMKHEENARDHPSVDIVLAFHENGKIIYDDENSEKTFGRFERIGRRRI